MQDKYLKTAAALLVEKTDKEEVVITPPLIEDEITITENGEYKSPIGRGYTEIHANVVPHYTEEDEGKVVQEGALVEQTDLNISENGTYDTTTVKSVVVDVASERTPRRFPTSGYELDDYLDGMEFGSSVTIVEGE